MDHVWQRWITPQITLWSTSSPQTFSDVTLVFRTMRLNHVPHQWCSGPRMMMQVWMCYFTVLWELYETCAISDRAGPPHRPLYHPQLQPRNDHLLHWLWDPKAWTMYLHQWCNNPRMMLEGWICHPTYIWVLYEAWTTSDRGRSPTDHSVTTIYTPTMLNCYPGFLEPWAWTMFLNNVVVV